EKGSTFIFTAEVAVKPEVTLGAYKGIEVEKKIAEVSPDEITAEMDKVREQNSRTITVDNRAAQMGDITTIDFEGFVDGEAFEGGKGEDYELTLGSHSFIDTFEDQLVGKNLLEETEVKVTFPEDYQAADLAGKAAVFHVKIKGIKAKELPELDDDFAQDISDFETLADYKADVEKKIFEKKEKQLKNEREEAIIEKIVEGATMEIPEPMVDSQVRQMADDFAQRVQSQGLSIEQYFQFTGMDSKKFMEQMRPQAVKRIQTRLVLETIVKAENIIAEEADVEKEIADMAVMYQMEADKLKEIIGENEREQIALDMSVQKAVELVVEASVEK
ncbi:MAG: trigger factor, partial [Acetivibrio sp.]